MLIPTSTTKSNKCFVLLLNVLPDLGGQSTLPTFISSVYVPEMFYYFYMVLLLAFSIFPSKVLSYSDYIKYFIEASIIICIKFMYSCLSVFNVRPHFDIVC